MIKIKYLTILFLSVVLPLFMNGQDSLNTKFNRLSVGINGGLLINFGDIKEKDFFPTSDELTYGGGLNLSYQISKILSVQAQGIYGNLAGTKTKFVTGATANLKFEASIIETSIIANVNFLRWLTPDLKINNIANVYALLGVGIVQFRSKLTNLQTNEFIYSYGYKNQGTEKTKMENEVLIPLGLGVKFKVGERINIQIETSIRRTLSTKLDAYVRYPGKNDKYNYTSVGVSYTFGKNKSSLEYLKHDPFQSIFANATNEIQNQIIVKIQENINAIDTKNTNAIYQSAAQNQIIIDSLSIQNQNLLTRIEKLEQIMNNGNAISSESTPKFNQKTLDSLNLLVQNVVDRLQKLEKNKGNIKTTNNNKIDKNKNSNSFDSLNSQMHNLVSRLEKLENKPVSIKNRNSIDSLNNQIQNLIGRIQKIEQNKGNNIVSNSNNQTTNKKSNSLDSLNNLVQSLINRIQIIEHKKESDETYNLLNSNQGSIDSLNKVIQSLQNRLIKLEERNVFDITYIYTKPEDVVKEIQNNGKVNMALSIFFDIGKTIVHDKFNDRIATVALYMKNNPNIKLQIIGHADETGTLEVNEQLSQKRAQNVCKILVSEFKISRDRIRIESKGNSIPLSREKNNLNRRVDFIFE